MAKHTEVNEVQAQGNPKDPSRRQFVNQALAVSAGVALSGFIPHLKAAPFRPFASCVPPSPGELVNPPEIVANGAGLLQATIEVKDVQRPSPVPGDSNNYTLRAYIGYKGHNTNPANRVSNPAVFSPGPTLRAPVGGELQIALLNHISPANFPESPDGACDVTTNATGTELYPDTPASPAQKDVAPDCFRGSNHTNMHFHGTHVSPNAFSDNVLISIAPDLKATAEDCNTKWTYACQEILCPQDWVHLPPPTKTGLMNLINQNNARLRALPVEKKDPQLHIREAEHNLKLVEYQEFPQTWSGCFPYCIRPPKFGPPWKMGQAPGTHWYHAHKHGSTSIQVYNGMEGALILEGDYDAKLKASMPGVEQKIMVIQQFAEQPNMERSGGAGVAAGVGGASGGAQSFLINGQSTPTVTMQTNEVQWWRMIDSSVQGNKGAFIPFFSANSGIVFRQIAQDGVQFAWQNYEPQLTNPPTNFLLAPGNRVDLLVKAPSSAGKATLNITVIKQGNPVQVPILNVSVVQGSGCNTKWPQTQAEFPTQPSFLADITSWSETRTLKYEMCARGSTPRINGKTFQEGIVNEAMLLDTKQEWTLQNYSTSAAGNPLHPFHIHINPFQIVEIFDPTGSLAQTFGVGKGAMFGDWSKIKINPNGSISLPPPWVWWDVFPLPLGKSSLTNPCPDPTDDSPPKDVTPGYIVMRTWFADFAGKFVNHCHILAHEDRGMMQLIEVYCNKTVVTHH